VDKDGHYGLAYKIFRSYYYSAEYMVKDNWRFPVRTYLYKDFYYLFFKIYILTNNEHDIILCVSSTKLTKLKSEILCLAQGRETKLTTTVSSISSLAYDPVSNNLYWIDPQRRSVLVQSLRTLAKRTILEGLVNPTAILFLADRRQLIVVDGARLLAVRPDGTGSAVLLTDQLKAWTNEL
jgi:hypothetical protein